MKVLPFKIPKPENNALIYQEDKGIAFYNKLHQHEEIQISIILKGEGDLVVGDTINRYTENDIVVIGSNLPHLFRSDSTSELDSSMLTLFFTKESFGKFFFDLIELKELETFFRKVDAGIRLLDHKEEVKSTFLVLKNSSHLERFIHFLNILKHITKSKTEALSSFIYQRIYSEDEGARMSNVMNHAMAEFNHDISLNEIAEIANMTPNAFCRYFKQRTNKTFFQFLTEIRLEHSCRLIVKNKDISIAEVSDLSGFKNMSNFNRKFKHYKGITPTSFRKSSSLV
ncbi:MAG: helix-turn-helix transcriptional regulator [Crocinitomicaceae bacterium]|nr:helix-turn-helix transcriptional regulator [Crocinitomicaceae bacterium]